MPVATVFILFQYLKMYILVKSSEMYINLFSNGYVTPCVTFSPNYFH
jgi:hypothetical protein